jgi:hypothetical protein
MIRASKNSPRLPRHKRQGNNSTRGRTSHDTELKRQIVLQGRWGDCEADASKNGADFCVTLCVTRTQKNGQIRDYA